MNRPFRIQRTICLSLLIWPSFLPHTLPCQLSLRAMILEDAQARVGAASLNSKIKIKRRETLQKYPKSRNSVQKPKTRVVCVWRQPEREQPLLPAACPRRCAGRNSLRAAPRGRSARDFWGGGGRARLRPPASSSVRLRGAPRIGLPPSRAQAATLRPLRPRGEPGRCGAVRSGAERGGRGCPRCSPRRRWGYLCTIFHPAAIRSGNVE